MVVIILLYYKWHMWTAPLWDGGTSKNTPFPGLPTCLSVRASGNKAFCLNQIMLHACETCAVKVDDIHRLVRNDHAMVRSICSALLCEKMSDLRTCMGISSIKEMIRYNCLHWFGHLQHMDEETWPRKNLNFDVNGSYPWCYPKKK